MNTMSTAENAPPVPQTEDDKAIEAWIDRQQKLAELRLEDVEKDLVRDTRRREQVHEELRVLSVLKARAGGQEIIP